MSHQLTWFGRLRSTVERALGIGIPIYAGSSGTSAENDYPVQRDIYAWATNPWVYACVQAIATDLSGVPLVAETGIGSARRQTADHWLLRLLERPNPKLGGRKFRKQLIADMAIHRNCYMRVWRDASGRPYQLARIHPGAIKAVLARDGECIGWDLHRLGQRLAYTEVSHISDISLSDTESHVYGDSPIRPLSLGLQVDADSRKHAGKSAKRGRLEMMLTPADPAIALGKDQIRAITDGYREAVSAGHGLYVVGKGMSAEPMSLNARDAEFLGITDRTRVEVLATFGVPDTRAGGPAPNYGTARQQMRTYWETMQGMAALFDDELSRLADDGVRIRHSFAGVDALQTSRTEQQARGSVWINDYGLSPEQAARYEGFADLPAPAGTPTNQRAPVAPSQDQNPVADQPRRSLIARIAERLDIAAGAYDSRGVETGEAVVRSSVCRVLLNSDVPELLAAGVAERAAELCTESYLALDAHTEVYSLRAFSIEHAAQIADMAGAC